MRLERLTQMGIDELALRSRQEASKWLDRMGASSDRGPLPPGAALPAEIPFLAGAQHEATVRLLCTRVPGERERLIASADAVCAGRFDLLGYRELSFGDPVDWHLDPVSGRRAGLVHWSRIDPLDAASVGDSKVIWELNRHQWFVTLGQAYRTTRDERYAEAFARRLLEWRRANPAGMGINWASSLEAALRVVSWSWAFALMRGSAALRHGLVTELVSGIREHATRVRRYLSHSFSPNTHLTGEALGLFYAGTVFPRIPEAARLREAGGRILVDELRRQVLGDGVYFEQSTCYQRYTVEIYLHFLILAARTRWAVPDDAWERVQRMLDFLLAVRGPDGRVPQIGDDDGGCLLPLSRREAGDLRGVFSTAAALFGRADYAWAAGGAPAAEMLWLLGPAGLAAFDDLEPHPPEGPTSRAFEQGGYAVMRSDWDESAHQLILRAGPLGCPVSGGHGHADLLSIQCSAFGEPYLVDAGTGSYTPEPAWRDFFRSAEAHSSATLDGARLAVPAGPFAWGARPSARLRRWRSTARLECADAEHDGYLRLRDPVVHRRRVAFVERRFWVIADEFLGEAEHHVELRFQFAPVVVAVDADGWVRARHSGPRGLLLRSFAHVPLEQRLRTGETDPIRGWISPDYGQKLPAPVAVYDVRAQLPLRILTLLVPVEDASCGPPPAVPVSVDRAGLRSLLVGDSEVIVFDPEDVALRSL